MLRILLNDKVPSGSLGKLDKRAGVNTFSHKHFQSFCKGSLTTHLTALAPECTAAVFLPGEQMNVVVQFFTTAVALKQTTNIYTCYITLVFSDPYQQSHNEEYYTESQSNERNDYPNHNYSNY